MPLSLISAPSPVGKRFGGPAVDAFILTSVITVYFIMLCYIILNFMSSYFVSCPDMV